MSSMSRIPDARHAFAVNPAGPVPYSGFQVFGIFLVCFAPVPALVACGLRAYSRYLSQGLGLDDWLIFIAAALGVPQAIFSTLFIRTGYWGIHDADIPPHPWNQGFFWSYMNRVFYVPLLVLVKISALLFLLRLGGTKRLVRLSCKALIALCIAQLLAFLPATIFMCRPVSHAWHWTAKGRCFRGDLFSVALASTNIITDILTLLIPFVAFLSIKLSNKIRFALLTVFALGGIVTLVSILRLYFVIRMWYLKPRDRHYSLGYTLNTIEVNLAIVTATIPALWPLGRRWFPAMFESMGINRPYLYPDIEVGYVSRGRHASQRAAGAGAGASSTAAAAAAQGSPALRGKILWLQRARPPSFLRPVADGPGPTDIRRQKAFGTTSRRSNLATSGSADDDEGLEDYHGVMRRAELNSLREDDDSVAEHKPPLGRESTRSHETGR